ncbi:MAG: flagellar biosynthetic protein FliO [Candidatus Latescibacteria bacterium]|nr:flagellar biosynthetic protein FliO [Candidatus Latescibacterota bacterium]
MTVLINVASGMSFVLYSAAFSFAAQPPGGAGVAGAQLPSAEFNLFFSAVKVVVALILTLALLIMAVWILKGFLKVRKIPGLSGGFIDVMEVRYIAPKKAVALVKVFEKVLIVGVSDQSLTTLGELTPEEIELLGTVEKPDSGVFKNILAGVTGRKGN